MKLSRSRLWWAHFSLTDDLDSVYFSSLQSRYFASAGNSKISLWCSKFWYQMPIRKPKWAYGDTPKNILLLTGGSLFQTNLFGFETRWYLVGQLLAWLMLSRTNEIQLLSIKSTFSSQCNRVSFYVGSKMDIWWAPIVFCSYWPTEWKLWN